MIHYSRQDNEKPIEQNCKKYSGEWYFQQLCYPWEFRKEMKLKWKDVIFLPFEDAGKIDELMRLSIT